MPIPSESAKNTVLDAAREEGFSDTDFLLRTWEAESSSAAAHDSKTVSKTGVKGPFQIIPSTWNMFMSPMPYRTDLKSQAICASRYLKYLASRYNGDRKLMGLAYNSGEFVANRVKAGDTLSDAVTLAVQTNKLDLYGKQTADDKIKEATRHVRAVTGDSSFSAGAKTRSVAQIGESEGVPIVASPLTSGPISSNAYNRLNSETLFEEDGLIDVVPWFNDLDHTSKQPSTPGGDIQQAGDLSTTRESLVVQNPRPKTPMLTFRVRLRDDLLSPIYLPNNKDKDPAVLTLNCSLNEMQSTYKHRIVNTPTRTGVHVTLWGMEADILTGSGSTGAWMNQYGLTSWMSTRYDDMPNEIINWLQDRKDKPRSEEPFRVAAQDAFAEMIALFKYNAITRFRDQNYTQTFSDRDQLGENLWSETRGASTLTESTRNGDVMRRGMVEIKIGRAHV